MEDARPATAADLPRIAELARQAITELSTQKGGGVWRLREARAEPLEEGLAADLRAPDHLVLVGTIDDAVVGYAVVIPETVEEGQRLARLEDLYVEPDARGVGVGAAMMHAVLAWAEEGGFVGIDSLALPGTRATKNFFESFGLTARAIVVHRSLGR
jgi:GNAT superfamily N-acetyltransferase